MFCFHLEQRFNLIYMSFIIIPMSDNSFNFFRCDFSPCSIRARTSGERGEGTAPWYCNSNNNDNNNNDNKEPPKIVLVIL